jgi:hypothetical protein
MSLLKESNTMFKSFIGWSVLAALTAALVVTPAATANAQNRNTNRLVVPITGTVTNAAGAVSNLAGNLAISRFDIQNGALVAIGQLTTTVTNAAGQASTIVTQVTLPVTSATTGASCDILNLVLGPLHLDLLGLVIDLNQVVLNITGQTGAGNLLGNLLCSITGLLDAGALGQQLTNLLNQLIGVLGAL